ncbi:MAG: twin-arginine translocase subunit TatC, partial [Candidatus Bathyarchaeia archaeon]
MPEGEEKTFSEHTEELIKRLKVVLITFIFSLVVMMVLPGNTNFITDPLNFYEPFAATFLKYIRERVLPPEVTLIGLEVTAPIELYVMAAVIFAIAITMPVFAYEAYRFIDPALTPEEKRNVYPFVLVVCILFVAGSMFGLFVLSPYFILSLLPFFQAVGAEPVIGIMDFYNVLFIATLATGLIFVFPVFFVLLVKFGVLSTGIFRRNRKYLYLGLLILA